MENNVKENVKKDIIVKIIVKEITKGKKTFNVYSGLTEKGNWFDITFSKDVVKPSKNIVVKVKGVDWFTTYKKDENDKLILDSKGIKIKKLFIMKIDEELNDDEIPQCFKNYDLDTDI